MELRHLRYFVAVSEAAHVGRAARRLHVAQSALSRQIQDLEAEVGVRLFDRVPQGVRLTAAGDAFLVHARAVLREAAVAVEAARQAAAAAAGRLRVAPPDFGAHARAAAEALACLRARLPEVAVEFDASPWPEHVRRLQEGHIDVGFGLTHDPSAYPSDLVAEALATEDAGWALLPAAHPLAAGARGAGDVGAGAPADAPAVPLAALAGALPFVFSERAGFPALYDAVEAAFRAAGVAPPRVTAPPTFAAVVQLVAGGAGWTAAVRSVVDAPPPGTAALRLADVPVHLHFVVLRRARDADAAGDGARPVARYLECLRATFARGAAT